MNSKLILSWTREKDHQHCCSPTRYRWRLASLSAVIVNGVRQIGAECLLQITAPILQEAAEILCVSNGKVIGVAAATFSEGQNLIFAIPVKYRRHLLAEMNPSSQTAEYEVTSSAIRLRRFGNGWNRSWSVPMGRRHQ